MGILSGQDMYTWKRGFDSTPVWPSYGTPWGMFFWDNLSRCSLRNCMHAHDPSGWAYSSLWGSGARSPAQYGQCRVMFYWRKTSRQVLNLKAQLNSAELWIVFKNSNGQLLDGRSTALKKVYCVRSGHSLCLKRSKDEYRWKIASWLTLAHLLKCFYQCALSLIK